MYLSKTLLKSRIVAQVLKMYEELQLTASFCLGHKLSTAAQVHDKPGFSPRRLLLWLPREEFTDAAAAPDGGELMHLTAREKDKLLIAMAAVVARRRLERGVKLNHPEAVALISDFDGAGVLCRDQGMRGVPEMIR